MPKKNRCALLISLITLLSAGPVSFANASNLLFLSNSVLTDLDPADADSLRNALQESLEQTPDFGIRTWRSAFKELEAKIQPLVSYQKEQQSCRQVRIQLSRPYGNNERYQFDFCRSTEQWDISYTPASGFNNNDWMLLQRTVQRALNDNNDGQPSSWTNHKTRHSGVVVPSASAMNAGQRCRQTAITIFDSHGRSSNGSYLFCLKADGQWQRRL